MEDKKAQEEIYSQIVRAGKRTYFFDVRATRADDYYLTITESKKFFNEDGSSHFKKHKIFLYKEDFEKFKTLLVRHSLLLKKKKEHMCQKKELRIEIKKRKKTVMTNLLT